MSILNKKLLVLALAYTTAALPADLPAAIAETYQAQRSDADFKYVEYVFIVKPTNTLKAQASTTFALLTAVAATGVMAHSYNSGKDLSLGNLNVLTVGSVGAVGGIAYNWYIAHLDANIKHKTLVNFIKNYDDLHRDFIAESLLPLFDEIASLPVEKLTPAIVDQVFEVVRHLIEHEFAKRYEKDKQKDADILSTAKSITDIYKNLK